MVEKRARDRDGLKAEYLNCSAVVSTKSLPATKGQRPMVGVPLRDASGRRIPPGEEKRFDVPGLPEEWPVDWKPGDFVFPEVHPRVPPRRDYPPDQVNLDRILNFLLV